MSIGINILAYEIYSEIIRAITGRLFTNDQITKITTHAVGKYFAEFFPDSEKNLQSKERVAEAKQHITEASVIISEIQSDLDAQTQQLDQILQDIENKKKLADKYSKLANINQEKFEAFKEEVGASLREELKLQSEQGKTVRRIASVTIWVVTLICGAALGAYFKEILNLFKTIFA